MKYNFDELIPRENTDSYKYKLLTDICGRTDVIPMWVADMDFRTPPFIFETIQKRLQQGILGYTCPSDAYYQAICAWNKKQYDMDVKPEMVNYIGGVVQGIYLAMQCFTEKGDKIMIQQPVYHPFRLVPEANERVVVMNELTRTADSFAMDFDKIREDLKGCKMMILCNPHNPGGVCWSKETLQELAHICAEEHVLVVSDEIHCDMLLKEGKHIQFASVSDEARNNSITLQAPTKTFNLPGIVAAQAIVYNEELRTKFFDYIHGSDADLGNILAFDCVRACYSAEGEEWKAQMLAYVQENINLLIDRLAAECPKISAIRPEASFLVFLDCRALNLTQPELIRFFADKAHLCLNSGDMFGPAGTGYMRMNVAVPHSVMNKAIDQLVAAANAL